MGDRAFHLWATSLPGCRARRPDHLSAGQQFLGMNRLCLVGGREQVCVYLFNGNPCTPRSPGDGRKPSHQKTKAATHPGKEFGA